MTPEIIIPAFLLGLGGSLHCIGMCGPLMLTFTFDKRQGSFPLGSWFIYHAGRILVYMVWGLVFGLIGSSVKWFGWQQNISLSLGLGILVILLLLKVFPSAEQKIGGIRWLGRLRNILVHHAQGQNRSSSFMGGMLNGLLPCGLVYVALAGATALQHPVQGALFMMVFGLGNLPLLAAFTIAGNKLKVPLRRKLAAWYPFMIGIMAVMLIIRGLNFGNMLSPSLVPGKSAVTHCATE